jgi:hypothetical protein
MSTSPDGRWRPTPDVLSTWVAISLLGMCLLNGVGFVYIGLRSRRPAWWIPGIVYLLAGPAYFLYSAVGTSRTGASLWVWGTVAWLAIWAVSFVHLFLVTAWLTSRADQPAPPADAAGLPVGLAPPPGDYYAPGPAAGAPAAAAPPVPVDVNTAGSAQLAALPGFAPDRVQRVLAERQARRGFGSVEEFAAAASLAPHEFVRVRELVVCAPAGRPQPSTEGRILDV